MISVIVTLKNKENTIISALQSIVAQSVQKWEAVIVDNGSTDGSEYQVRSYLIDRRMRYLKLEKEVSVAEARQKGLEMTSGEWVLFMDGSDYLEVNALEALYLSVKKYGTSIAVGNFSFIKRGEKQIQNFIPEGIISASQFNKTRLLMATGTTLMGRSVATRPELWETSNVAYTDHLVVINGEGEQPLIKPRRASLFSRLFSWFNN
ncbi:MAG: glycosyltransferase [Paludibacteraceae bacterium]|nr:glycosyltransferase [Paludibacteraceae bacterium]